MADASGNNANYYGIPYPIDSGKYTTVAGEFQNSDSPYGTFDQGGNVWEWNEARISSAYRGVRGGSFSDIVNYLQASGRFYNDPTFEDIQLGFRVSEVVPEPSSILALAGGLASLIALRRRRV
jgi:formylglycine-generating enzyme required for sulfatase activity